MQRGETVDHRPSEFWPLLHTALHIIGQNIDPSEPSAPMAEPLGTMRRVLRERGGDGGHMGRPSLKISIGGKLGPARGPQRLYLGRYGHSALLTILATTSNKKAPNKRLSGPASTRCPTVAPIGANINGIGMITKKAGRQSLTNAPRLPAKNPAKAPTTIKLASTEMTVEISIK